eukprot:2556274-Pleurochrysis_carterae.AAC.1
MNEATAGRRCDLRDCSMRRMHAWSSASFVRRLLECQGRECGTLRKVEERGRWEHIERTELTIRESAGHDDTRSIVRRIACCLPGDAICSASF